MATTTRVQWYLDNDAVDMVSLHADSEKKKGQWVSEAIREFAQRQTIDDADQECGTLEQLIGLVRRVEARIIRLEVGRSS